MLLLIVLGALQLATTKRLHCEIGKGYKGRGHPTSTRVDNFALCQASCHKGGSKCSHFSYDYRTEECWLLSKEAELQKEVTLLSGTIDCLLPSFDDVKATDSEKSIHMHRMLSRIAAYVVNRSKDEVVVGYAKHLENSARHWHLNTEDYEKVIQVVNARIQLLDSGSLVEGIEAASVPSRDDLDWLLEHMTGIEVSPMAKQGGDGILPGRHSKACNTRACLKGAGQHIPWSDAKVKYCFEKAVAEPVRSAILCGMNQIRDELPGISFVDVGYHSYGYCNEFPAVYIQSSGPHCWADIGMQEKGLRYIFGLQGNQQLNLQSPGCDDCGTAIHELLHSMGVAHEHQRPDRDKYVRVVWKNLQHGAESEYKVDPDAGTSLPFDIMSIMNYGKYHFSWNGRKTIEVKDKGYDLYTTDPARRRFFEMGQMTTMTKYDVAQLARLYHCTSKSHCGAPRRAADVPLYEETREEILGDFVPAKENQSQGPSVVLIVIIGSVLAVTIALVTTTLACCKSESNVEDSRSLLRSEPEVGGPKQ